MEDGIPGGLQHHHEMCCEKGGCRGRQACMCQTQSSMTELILSVSQH